MSDEAIKARNWAIKMLHKKGVPKSEIGLRYGISRERVRQIVGNGTFVEKPSIVGHTFGRLTVTSEDPMRTADSWVTCSCSCGGQKSVQRGHLRPKHGVRSCGCLHLEVAKRNGPRARIDLVGQRFGKLVVTRQWWENGPRRHGLRNSRSVEPVFQRYGFVACVCDCGCQRERIYIQSLQRSVQRGLTPSCGCVRRRGKR